MAIKVFQLITSVALGGAENVAFALAEGVVGGHGQAFEVHVVELFRSNTDYARRKRVELQAAGLRIITLSPFSKRVSLLVAPLSLAWHLLRQRPAIVHAHTDLPDLVLGIASRLCRWWPFRSRPHTVRTVHNVSLWRTHRALGSFTERTFDDTAVAAVSDGAMQAYEEARRSRGLALCADRRVIYNGCPPPQPLPPPFGVRGDNKLQILFCGRFDEQKGVDVLAAYLRTHQPQLSSHFTFHFVGAGPLRPLLLALRDDCPMVRLHDPVPGVANFFHAFDAMVMPSRFEGLPLVAIEASLARLPVVAARAPGLTESLPPDWPLYFELTQPASLTRLLQQLAADPAVLRVQGDVAQAFASRKFSLPVMLRHYQDLYTRVLNGGCPARNPITHA